MDRKKKEFFEQKAPLLCELYYWFKDLKMLKRRLQNQKAFKKMTDDEMKQWVAGLYYKYQHEQLDWENLRTWSQKIQWVKLYDKDPRKTICADKYAVRDWVKDKIGEEYLIPLLGVWDKYSDIDFEKLPEKFVIKTNHGAGEAVIVRNKSEMKLADKLKMRRKIEISMATDYCCKSGEMHYKDIPHKIIAEELIEFNDRDLPDYKFICFDGVPYIVWIDIDRFSDHRRNIYDMNWVLQRWNQKEFVNTDYEIEKPENFDKMVEIVKVLSEGFSHVRVDLYNVNGKIYFGEMTFTSGSGFAKITSHSADEMLGELWKLDMKKTG